MTAKAGRKSPPAERTDGPAGVDLGLDVRGRAYSAKVADVVQRVV